MSDDPSDIEIDDLATQEDISEIRDALDDLRGGGESDDSDDGVEPAVPWDEPDDAPFTTPDDARETADQTFMDRLQHLAHDDCDTPECEQLRDALGIGDPDGADSSEGGADADGGADAEQGPDHDHEGDEGNDGDGNPGESESTSGSDGDSGTDDGDSDTVPWEL